jgi:hypothetical protein
MKIWQLAPDPEAYGEHAGWYMVVSDDLATDLDGPYRTLREAQAFIAGRRIRKAIIGALTWLGVCK